MESEYATLRAQLKRIDARRRYGELLTWLPWAIGAGLLIALTAAVASRARPLMTTAEIARLAAAVTAALALVTVLLTLARRRATADQARFADQRFELRERAIAAVEIRDGHLTAPPTLAQRQLNEALRALERVDIGQQMPLSLVPRHWLLPLALLLALALALWLPNPQQALLQQQRAVAATIAEQAAAVAGLAEQIAADEGLSPEQRDALSRPLEEALAALIEPGVGQADALAALSEAEAETRRLSREFAAAALNDGTAAGRALSENENAAELGAALQAEQAATAAAAAGELADRLAELEGDERQALADALAQAAVDTQPGDPALAEALARAAEALAEGDVAAAQAALDEAAGRLAEQAQAGAAAERADETAGQLDQAGQEVAAAGTGQPAAAGTGQPAAAGTGESAAGGDGEAAASQDPAGGVGGEDQPGGAGTSGEQGQQSATGGPTPGGGHVESVFVPAPANLDGEGQDVELDIQCLGRPEGCGPLVGQSPGGAGGPGGSFVPFDQVFGNYRDAAIEALPGSGVPVGLQNLVRDYFSALEP